MKTLHDQIQEAKARLPLPKLMERLGLQAHAKKSARCPFHEDQRESFSVFEGEGGKWFWKCHAGCGSGDEIRILEKQKGWVNGEAVRGFLLMADGIRAISTSKESAESKLIRDDVAFEKKKIVSTYDYLSETKEVLYQVVRFEPKGFCQRHQVEGKWIWNMNGVSRVLFNLPKVLKANRVWICEGEKDAMNLNALGFIATCNVGGAGKWLESYSEVLKGKEIVLCGDNDEPGRKHMAQVFQSLAGKAKSIRQITTPKFKDVSDYIESFATREEAAETLAGMAESAEESNPEPVKPRVWIEFCTPSQLKSYVPPEGLVLIGNCHVTRGSVFVIGGAPGIGKSRAAVALAQAGATGADWFGLKVHRKFKTMILQNENGRFRLSKEFADLDCEALDSFVRVCPPPPSGMAFNESEFVDALKTAIEEFQPDVVLLDPWNSVAQDDKASDYLKTFKEIRSLLPTGDAAPALGIVAHTVKPKSDDRSNGRGLLRLLSGSYVLGSVPRTVFILQAASDDTEDNRVVWTCCKNNDGEMGSPSAWERRNGLFALVSDFDWEEFNKPSEERKTITKDHLKSLFEEGSRKMIRTKAMEELKELSGCGKSACYSALKLDGKFGANLREEEGLLTWIV